jgi:error-prone DNA polymerase
MYFAQPCSTASPWVFISRHKLLRDAIDHGVKVAPVDVNYSYWDNTLEEKAGNYSCGKVRFPADKRLA